MAKIKASPVVRIITLFIISLFFTACSMNTLYRKKGLELINSGNYDEAVRYYSNQLKKNPGSANLRSQLLRAKSYSYFSHVSSARNFFKKGNFKEADKHYKIAFTLFPKNTDLRREYDMFLNKGRKKSDVKIKSEIAAPVKLKVDNQNIDSLGLKNTSIKKIFNIVGKSYNVNFIFDKDFRDFPYSIEVENISFFEILKQLCLVTNSRYRIIDASSVLIYPNTSFKKRNFDLRGVKVFFLSNITGEDAKKLIIPMFRDEQIMIQEDVNLNSIIVKAGESTLREIEKFIRKIEYCKERS